MDHKLVNPIGIEDAQRMCVRLNQNYYEKNPDIDNVLQLLIESKRLELLSNAMRVNQYISPLLMRIVEDVLSQFQEKLSVELYITASSEINSYCLVGNDTILIVATSALINMLDEEELYFLIGHEVGHYLYNTRRFYTTNSTDDELKNRILNEINADRFGFLVTPNKYKAYTAMLKMVCGLDSKYINFNVGEYIKQFKEANAINEVLEHYKASTHPFFPIRIRALLFFEMSDIYYDMHQLTGKSPFSIDAVNEKIIADISKLHANLHEESQSAEDKELIFYACLLGITLEGEFENKKEQLDVFTNHMFTGLLHDYSVNIKQLMKGLAAKIVRNNQFLHNPSYIMQYISNGLHQLECKESSIKFVLETIEEMTQI